MVKAEPVCDLNCGVKTPSVAKTLAMFTFTKFLNLLEMYLDKKIRLNHVYEHNFDHSHCF